MGMRLAGFLVLLHVAARAQTTAPTDSSSPLESLRVLINSVETGESEVTRRHLVATAPQDRRLIESIAGLSAAVGRVRAATAARWGDESARALRISLISNRTLLDGRLIDETSVADALAGVHVIDSGDRARIQFGDDPAGFVVMLRIDGVWKLAIDETLTDPERPSPQTLADAFSAAAGRIDQLARDIADGKLSEAAQIQPALQAAARPQA